MPNITPEQSALMRLVLLVAGLILLADLALFGVIVAGRVRGRSLLARRWSAAHVLIGFQAWLAITLFVSGVGMAVATVGASGASLGALAASPLMRSVLLGSLVVQNAAMIGVVLFTVVGIYDQHPRAAGLSLRGWAPRTTVGLLAAAVVLPLNALLEQLSALALRHAALPSLVQREFEAQFAQVMALFNGSGGLFLAILVIGIIAPLGEEVFFRGFAYRCFRARWGPAVATVVSAALFSLIHLHPLGALPIFVVGCALALLYERTGTLVAPFVLHAVNNTVAVLALYLGRHP